MRTTWLSIVALAWAVGVPAAAQDRPVVFVHGLQGTGLGWGPGASYLRQRLHLFDIRPTLGWTETYQTQASNLQAAVSPYGGVTAVSHSNGGIVTRQYGRTVGSASRITGHLAVGSLHQGAALANNARNGNVVAYAGFLFNSIGAPLDFYSANDPDWYNLIFFTALEEFAQAGAYVAYAYAYGIAYLGFPIPAFGNPPVLPQMEVGSSLITDLNGAGLAAEASAFQQRISMSTQIPANDVVARIWCGDLCTVVRRGLQYYAGVMWAYYVDHPDLWLRSHAWLWEQLFWAMYDFDVVWHYFIGSLIQYDGFRAVVYAQDGILPIWTQTYVNGTNPSIHITSAIIDHFQQRSHVTALTAMSDVLVNNFGILRRAPPPPPLSAYISGPGAITAKGTYTWEAMPSNGSGGYTYQWSIYYPQTGFSQTLGTTKTQKKTVYANDDEFELQVRVQSGGSSVTPTLLVQECIGTSGGCYAY